MERRLYMVIYEGKAVFEGVAIGKLSVYKKNEETDLNAEFNSAHL